MTRFSSTRRLRAGVTALVAAAVIPFAACSPDRILDVTDPDIIEPGAVNSPEGADALRVGALGRLNIATSGSFGGSDSPESFFMWGGLMADEWRSGDTFVQRDETDKRSVQTNNGSITLAYRNLHRARLSALQAARALQEFAPAEPQWKVAEMYWAQGLIEVMLGEHFCSGVPFSDVVDGEAVYGEQTTTVQTFERALAHFDSALVAVDTASGADFARVRNLAAVGRGRALLNLGRFAEAAAAVAAVSTDFEYLMEHSQTTRDNLIWGSNNNTARYTVADQDGGNGLNFVTANDPRVPVCAGGSTACRAVGITRTRAFDSITPYFAQLIWPTRESPVAIVTGVEARLIEAEALLQAQEAAGWLAVLNGLRADPAVGAARGIQADALPALADPGTAADRENLHFRERAFWLFSTGHRLGDLRRLVRQYGRLPETVFPTGMFFKGGTYGTDVNFPIPQAEENNPAVDAVGGGVCIDRNA